MTNDERWEAHWTEIMQFMDQNDRNPSKYKPEERRMINWLKANRKVRNAGKLEPNREAKLKVITDRMAQLHRRNQPIAQQKLLRI